MYILHSQVVYNNWDNTVAEQRCEVAKHRRWSTLGHESICQSFLKALLIKSLIYALTRVA